MGFIKCFLLLKKMSFWGSSSSKCPFTSSASSMYVWKRYQDVPKMSHGIIFARVILVSVGKLFFNLHTTSTILLLTLRAVECWFRSLSPTMIMTESGWNARTSSSRLWARRFSHVRPPLVTNLTAIRFSE